jgi:hypothetical protein
MRNRRKQASKRTNRKEKKNKTKRGPVWKGTGSRPHPLSPRMMTLRSIRLRVAMGAGAGSGSADAGGIGAERVDEERGKAEEQRGVQEDGKFRLAFWAIRVGIGALLPAGLERSWGFFSRCRWALACFLPLPVRCSCKPPTNQLSSTHRCALPETACIRVPSLLSLSVRTLPRGQIQNKNRHGHL